MKLIIIEGPDNCGKNTIINKISENYKVVTIIHCGKPISKDPEESAKEQDELFNKYADDIINHKFDSSDVVIMNRAWYGEYVYGAIYRNRQDNDIVDMIHNIETKLNNSNVEMYYVQLISASIDLLYNNDDALSLSNNKKELIEIEIGRFLDIYNKSLARHKKMVVINDNDNFRNPNDIANEIKYFLNNPDKIYMKQIPFLSDMRIIREFTRKLPK